MRIGISAEHGMMNQIDFVLLKYTPDELKVQMNNIDRAADACIALLKDSVEKVMNDFNANPVNNVL